MEAKNSNTPVVVIALSVVIIVAMICGMVIWLMQRSMAMNERLNDRLLEIRLQEAKAHAAEGAPGAVPAQAIPDTEAQKELEAIRAQLKSAEASIQRESEARRKAEQQMAELKSQQTQPPLVQESPPTPPADTAKTAPEATLKPKRQAPTELPASASRVGEDGYPINRITLPIGNDELDWQL